MLGQPPSPQAQTNLSLTTRPIIPGNKCFESSHRNQKVFNANLHGTCCCWRRTASPWTGRQTRPMLSTAPGHKQDHSQETPPPPSTGRQQHIPKKPHRQAFGLWQFHINLATNIFIAQTKTFEVLVFTALEGDENL